MQTRTLSFALAATTLALAACSASDVRQTGWAKSPDDQWETRLVERNTSGPGNNSLYKDVEVRRVGTEEPVRIVTLDEGQGASRVKLRWKSQSRLEVSYEGAPLLLQVVRVGELTIATTDVSQE